MKVKVIRVDGSTEALEIQRGHAMTQIRHIIHARDGCDVVNLRDGTVMIVDDTGLIDNRPVNSEATKLYWAVCIPGTTHPICGDVVIATDSDFA